MKRIVSIILTLMLLPCLFIQTLAAENTSPNLIQTGENGTTYFLTSLDDGSIIKSYQKAGQTNLSTTAVLSDLGMGDKFIDQLSPEAIQIYENAESITSITTYSKTSADGSTTYLSRREALSEIASTRAIVVPPIIEGDGFYTEEEFLDDYMKITFTVGQMTGGHYYMTADAEWLTMPTFRGYDSIGISAQDCTIVNNTRQGWFRYNCTETVDGDTTQYETTEYFDSTNIRNAQNAPWAGAGAIFELPADWYFFDIWDLETDSKIHSNLTAHFEVKFVLSTPATEHYFNATATYEHLRLDVEADLPSLALDIPSPSFGIGISIVTEKDTRVVELPTPIHYIP